MFDWLRRRIARRRIARGRPVHFDGDDFVVLGQRVAEAMRDMGMTADEAVKSPLFQRAEAKRGNLDRMMADPDVLEARRALMATQAELVKAQIVSATRLDVIRLLGTLGTSLFSYPPDSELPDDPESRALLALQLQELSQHLRDRAESYAKIAAYLDTTRPG